MDCWHARIVEGVPARQPLSPEWSGFAAGLGRNMQRRRLALGLSQDKVAYRAQLSRFTYQKYESGVSRPGLAANPSLRSLLAIAQVLETDIDALLPSHIPDLTQR